MTEQTTSPTPSTTAPPTATAPAAVRVTPSADGRALDATHGTVPAEPFPGGRGPSPLTPSDETTWSTVTHLSWLAGTFVGFPLLGPLVLFLVLRERGPFVRHHTAEALNLHLSLLVYGVAVAVLGGLLTVLTFGIAAPVWALAGVVLVLVGAVLSVLAGIAASRGQWYRYPLTIRFVE